MEVSVSVNTSGDESGTIGYAERIPLVIDPGADHATVIADLVMAIGAFRHDLLNGLRSSDLKYRDPAEHMAGIIGSEQSG